MASTEETPGLRRWPLWVYGILVLVWTLAGTLGWAGEFKAMGLVFIIPSFPALVTTWPAHELLLEISGVGAGANAVSDVSVASFLAFFAWSALLWSPLLSLRWRAIPAAIGVSVQVVFLVTTFGLFFRYGNG